MNWFTSVLNLALRAFSLAARFLLSIFMVKYFALSDIGLFGLMVSVTAGAPAVLGFGLNYFINREIVTMPLQDAVAHVRDRLTLSFALCFGVSALFVLGVELWWSVPELPSLWLLIPVFVLETLALDLHFSLLSLKRAVLANTLLFFRSAIWVYPFMLLAWLSPGMRTLDWLLAFWLTGLITLLVALYIVSRDWRLQLLSQIKYNIQWVLSFSKKSKFIYLSDISIFLSMFIDRFFLSGYIGLSELGIFIFCSTVAGSVYLLTSAAIIQNLMPILVSAINDGAAEKLKKTFYAQLISAIFLSFILSGIIFYFFKVIVEIINRPELIGSDNILIFLLISGVIRVGSDIFGQLMYALRLDRQWALVNILGMLFVIFFIVFLTPFYGMIGAALASIISGLLMILIKWYLCIKKLS